MTSNLFSAAGSLAYMHAYVLTMIQDMSIMSLHVLIIIFNYNDSLYVLGIRFGRLIALESPIH